MMTKKSSLLLASLVLPACTWLQDYDHCTCTVEAKDCDYLEVTTEQLQSIDQKELEKP